MKMTSGYNFLPLIILLALSNGLFGEVEEVRMRIYLEKGENGSRIASIFVGNDSSEEVTNQNMLLDITTVVDSSDNTIDVRGLVVESDKNISTEFSTFNEASMAEEIEVKNEGLKNLRLLMDKEANRLQSTMNEEAQRRLLYFCPEKVRRPEGYKFYPGFGYYKFYFDYVNFPTASMKCRQDGAHLAIINSEAEAIVLDNIIKKYGLHDIWIGVYDPKGNGDFRTVFGAPLNKTGYTNWQPGEPNGAEKKEFCVHSYLNIRTWNSLKCDQTLPYICEHVLMWDDL